MRSSSGIHNVYFRSCSVRHDSSGTLKVSVGVRNLDHPVSNEWRTDLSGARADLVVS
jgi:hypothetical protein